MIREGGGGLAVVCVRCAESRLSFVVAKMEEAEGQEEGGQWGRRRGRGRRGRRGGKASSRMEWPLLLAGVCV